MQSTAAVVAVSVAEEAQGKRVIDRRIDDVEKGGRDVERFMAGCRAVSEGLGFAFEK